MQASFPRFLRSSANGILLALTVFVICWLGSEHTELFLLERHPSTLHYRTPSTVQKWTEIANSTGLYLHNTTLVKDGLRKVIFDDSQRWSSKQVLTWLRQGGFSNGNWSDLHFLKSLPTPKDEDIEIYNLAAWRKLRSLLGWEISDGRTITRTSSSDAAPKVVFCPNGGSVTAGAGNVMPHYRWDNKWVDFVRAFTHHVDPSIVPPSIEAANRAHGSRDSAHTAILMHTFIPDDVDILVWEFSVNDSIQQDCTRINNMMIKYLDQIEWQYRTYYQRDPPLVVLSHVWSNPFSFVEEDNPDINGNRSKIRDKVFACHDRFPAGYDFVVGTVNLASYVSHRFNDWSEDSLKRQFTVDKVHPSKFGHAVLAFLLWDFVANGDQRRIISADPQRLPKKVELACDQRNTDTNDSAAISRIETLLIEQPSLASWSAETPKNTVEARGMINPSVSFLSSDRSILINETALHQRGAVITMYGKADAARIDRKYSARLPCCSSQERLTFDLTSGRNSRQGLSISAIQVFSGDEKSKIPHVSAYLQIEMLLDGSLSTTEALSVNASWVIPPKPKKGLDKEDDCQIGRQMQRSWLVLHEPTPIKRLDFCNRQLSPQKENALSSTTCPQDYTLAHLALF